MKVFGAFGIVGILMWLAAVSFTIYGVILAFSASLALGIISLFVQPAPLVFAILMIFGGVNVPEKIVHWYSTTDTVTIQVKHP